MVTTSNGYLVSRDPKIKSTQEKLMRKSLRYRDNLDKILAEGRDLKRRQKIRAEWVKEVQAENEAKKLKAYLSQPNPGSRSGGIID